MALLFTDTVISHSVASRGYRYPDADLTIVETIDESFIEDTIKTYDKWFKETDEVTFQKLIYVSLLDTFQQEFDDSLLEDFEETLREAKEPEQPSLEIDPVFGSILVGGYHETSFYQLPQWGEDIGLGSRAKFSRLNRELEEQGIIEHGNIPRQVGRPRHSLLLGEAVAEEASIDESLPLQPKTSPESLGFHCQGLVDVDFRF